MILRSKLRLAAGAGTAAAALLAGGPGGDAFTAETLLGSARRRRRSVNNGPGPRQWQPQQRQPQEMTPLHQAQFFDADGNPVTVTMPMVKDANGNLVPLNLASQPPAQQQQQQQFQPLQPTQRETSSQIGPGPVGAAITEPPLPPRTKESDSPRPVGFNPDAYTMSNTADVYLAQLKQDTKVRKIARMRGDLETANSVFGDDSVRQIKDSWKENPYTKEKNHAEARAEIEGTVRLQVQEDDTSANAGVQQISYKQKLAEMQRRRSNVGAGSMPPATVEQPTAIEQKPVADELESKVMEHLTPGTIPDMPPPSASAEQPQNAGVQFAASRAPLATETATASPVADPVASVEATLERYKNASPEQRVGMLAELQKVMMAASNASVEAARAATPVAETPPVPETQEPPQMMGFPVEYVVTKPDEEASPAQ